MKNNQCQKCQVTSQVNQMIFGEPVKSGFCTVCRKDAIETRKAENRAQPKIGYVALNNVTNNPEKWTPEIADAMRLA